MLSKLKNLIKSDDDKSIAVSEKIVKQFRSNPDFPYLVSFPRTGSHWLRMLMELYFEQPTLIRTFYHFKKQDYLLLHTHDLDLTTQRKNVIYLYREPVSTIYSQLQYHRQDVHNHEHIAHWANLYGNHLDKWLVQEKFTSHKTVISYEALVHDLPTAFSKVVSHFGKTFDADKFAKTAAIVTKEEVKRKTPHDEQVVQINIPYEDTREVFREKHERYLWDVLLTSRPHLSEFFGEEQ